MLRYKGQDLIDLLAAVAAQSRHRPLGLLLGAHNRFVYIVYIASVLADQCEGNALGLKNVGKNLHLSAVNGRACVRAPIGVEDEIPVERQIAVKRNVAHREQRKFRHMTACGNDGFDASGAQRIQGAAGALRHVAPAVGEQGAVHIKKDRLDSIIHCQVFLSISKNDHR